MAGNPSSNDGVDIFSLLDPKTGDRYAQAYLTPKSDTREKNVYLKVPAVIPIVFLPGIMGTNLKVLKSGRPAWRPPNGFGSVADALGTIAAAWTWGWRGPRKRQEVLKGEDLIVDEGGEIDVGRSGLSPALARTRGWGSAVRGSYHPFMALLQERLNDMARTGGVMTNFKPQLDPWWGGQDMTPRPGVGPGTLASWNHGIAPPADYGAEQELPALTEAEILHAARYQYDVWCAGYNWLKSNRVSSMEDVKRYLEDEVLAHYRKKGIPADKVILVSHSMGGLVSRALTEVHKYPDVLGVVHGVQPATGAPTIYHHCRCGYEGSVKLVLGSNAGEVISVVGNAPGALELVPTFDYRDGQPWLFVANKHGGSPRPVGEGEPYDKIYTTPEWYGLVPEKNSKYLDLSGEPKNDPKYEPRGRFLNVIKKVKKFHQDISGKYHDDTYAHYGADTSDDRHGWETIHWKGDPELLKLTHEVFDDKNGNYVRATSGGERVLSLKPGPGCAGDGTVAAASGAAPGKAGVKASFRHGNQGSGAKNKDKEGYDHQDSYNDPRAQWAALYSIVKIAQLANWHG